MSELLHVKQTAAPDVARVVIAAQVKMMVTLKLCTNSDDILDKISYKAN